MRKAAFLTMAVVAVGGTAGVAYAAIDKTQTLVVKTSAAAGTTKKPAKVVLDVTTGTSAVNPAQSGTFAATQAIISLDKNLKFNNTKKIKGKVWPSCTKVKVVANTCPKGSKIGTGSAKAEVGEGGGIKPEFKITAYNGEGGLILQLKGQGGFSDQEKILVGKLKNATGKYGKKLVVDIPLEVQQPVPGLKATLTEFKTKISATYKGVNYVESVGCTAKKYNFSGTFKFDDGDTKTAVATSKCRKP